MISVVTSIIVHVLLTKYQRRENLESSSGRQVSKPLSVSKKIFLKPAPSNVSNLRFDEIQITDVLRT